MKMNAVATFLSAVLLAYGTASAAAPADAARLDEVERRGAEVMPFSLERTVHVFTKTERGGLQQVLARDDADAGQVALIREHLQQVAGRFARGDFTDPAAIHGDDMPGLEELRRARSGQIEVVYGELPRGAQIEYATRDPALIAALHRWFDAQLSDHARHAVSGHPHEHPAAH